MFPEIPSAASKHAHTQRLTDMGWHLYIKNKNKKPQVMGAASVEKYK